MKRIALDLSLLLLIVLAMSFHFLPKILHEVLGLLALAIMLWHLVWNRRWFSSLWRGRQTFWRLWATAVNFLLILSMAATLLTGICISNHLFKDMLPLYLQRNMTIHQLHVSLPYLLLILAGLHLGAHWQGWRERLRQKMRCHQNSHNSHKYLLFKGLILLLFMGIGIYGSFLNRVGDRLLMKHIFATEAIQQPFGVFVLLILGIVLLYAVPGYWLQTLAHRKKNR